MQGEPKQFSSPSRWFDEATYGFKLPVSAMDPQWPIRELVARIVSLEPCLSGYHPKRRASQSRGSVNPSSGLRAEPAFIAMCAVLCRGAVLLWIFRGHNARGLKAVC